MTEIEKQLEEANEECGKLTTSLLQMNALCRELSHEKEAYRQIAEAAYAPCYGEEGTKILREWVKYFAGLRPDQPKPELMTDYISPKGKDHGKQEQ